MKIFNSVLAVLAVLLVFTQCAEKENENYNERELAVFDLWMERYNPKAEKLDNGMYVEWFRKGSSGTKLSENNFMYVDYVGRDLNGNIFSNRDSAIAVRENTFSLYTHYTPHYAIYNKEAYHFTAGEYEALGLMSKGDSLRLFLPAQLAYGTSSAASYFQYGTYGYEGWYNSASNIKNTSGSGSSASIPSLDGKPVIIDLALRDVVTDASERELSDATAAASALGYNVQDTIRKGLYFRYVEQEDSDVSGEDKDSEVIAEDSSFYFVYALWFLDDFLIATNDAATASIEWNDYYESSYSPTYFSASSSTFLSNSTSGFAINALNELIKSERIRYNSRMQIVFTSDWAYSYYGYEATSTRPVIYPYTPLKLDIITLHKEYDPNAKDEDEDSE